MLLRLNLNERKGINNSRQSVEDILESKGAALLPGTDFDGKTALEAIEQMQSKKAFIEKPIVLKSNQV